MNRTLVVVGAFAAVAALCFLCLRDGAPVPSDDDAFVAGPRTLRRAPSAAAPASESASTDAPSGVDVEAALRRLARENAQLRAELGATRRRLNAFASDLDETRRLARARDPVVVGAWLHSVDGRAASPLDLADDGTLRDGAGNPTGKWSRTGSSLLLRWPRDGAPGGGEWIDSVVVSADGASYVGMNQRGSVIRGERPR